MRRDGAVAVHGAGLANEVRAPLDLRGVVMCVCCNIYSVESGTKIMYTDLKDVTYY